MICFFLPRTNNMNTDNVIIIEIESYYKIVSGVRVWSHVMIDL